MAMIDYGALLRVDGKFINKNKGMFMDSSDTGYVCNKATDKEGNVVNIDRNYFVYAGDKNFLLVFYKGLYKVISNEEIIFSQWDMPFNAETHYFEGLTNVKVSQLSKWYEIVETDRIGTWEDFVKEYWAGTTGKEKLSELADGYKYFKRFRKRCKKAAYVNRHGGAYKTRSCRYIAEWEYNGHKYEVIFGYGIDNDEKVWNEIKNKSYGFREDEIELIDSWFTSETR